MILYKFHHAMNSDRNILTYALKNELNLEVTQTIRKSLTSEFAEQKTDILLMEECLNDPNDLDNVWYIAYNSPLGIYLFEITDSLLERTNYGLTS